MKLKNPPIKFFDKTAAVSDELLSKLYVAMSDVHKIDNWHQYMTNPLPISSFECLYNWEDVVRNRNFAKNSKFTIVDKKYLEYIHYTITPIQTCPCPYFHNSVRFSFKTAFRMERWLKINPDVDVNEQYKIKNLKHHANGIFNKIIKAKIDGDTLKF